MSEIYVREVMSKAVVTVCPEDSIHEAARRLADHAISGMPVLAGTRLVGVVSESDIIDALTPEREREAGLTLLDFMARATRRVAGHRRRLRVEDIMSGVVIDISPFASVWEAASVMHSHGVKRLPVTENEGRVVGIVSRADLVRVIACDDASIERPWSTEGPSPIIDLAPGSKGGGAMDGRTDGRGHDEAVMPWQLAPIAVESEHHAPEPLEETLIETDFVVPWQMSPSDTRRVQLVPASSGEPGRVVRRRRLTFRRPQGGWG